ncbi:LLM class flavin-dependent oxidoreductase [Vagococcus coleopterorum]|uniref:LLM class flavin-dependent oxidoreductase n=2 Tax=Vagococcus coleopterorum TaxID=2714946 RepID=A0A6G8AQ06_9ENTE|nr:LLM class flavin-dependent oxidoreductase [Vagococcus coleopterorum]QIL47015.1 LLM class flavin-dependent oxidoreductase [Vagococcus coleopterorum]
MNQSINTLPFFDKSKGMEIGIYSLGDHLRNPHTNKLISAGERINQIKEMAIMADDLGLDVFMLGESHQDGFVSQAHTVILSAIAEATTNIKLSSGASIISTSDPVRVFEDFATMDLLSGGRMEIVGGRASRIGLFELLGYDVKDYEALFEEKFELLLEINRNSHVTWNGQYRAPLNKAHVIPRPLTKSLPIWRAVGGGLSSAAAAGRAGVPMNLAMLGGPAGSFKRTIDVYRESASLAGHDPKTLPITTSGFFYTAPTIDIAMREFYPHVNEGMFQANGQGFSKQAFMHAKDPSSVMNIGSPNEIIEKLISQHELFGSQRYMAQLDFGGIPFEKIKQNIEILATEIMPKVKKYTAEKE